MNESPYIRISGDGLANPETLDSVMQVVGQAIVAVAAGASLKAEVIIPEDKPEIWEHHPLGLSQEDFDRLRPPADSVNARDENTAVTLAYRAAAQHAANEGKIRRDEKGILYVGRETIQDLIELYGRDRKVDPRRKTIRAGTNYPAIDVLRQLLAHTCPPEEPRA